MSTSNIVKLIICMICLSIFGCKSRDSDNKIDVIKTTPKEETRTVDWYISHESELKEKLNECGNNPGLLKDTPNCINAKEAHNRGSLDGIGKVKF